MLAGGLEDALQVDVAGHGVQLRRADAHGVKGDVARNGVPLDVTDVAADRDVAAHALQTERALRVLERDLPRHRLHVHRSADAARDHVAGHGLRVDAALLRDGDVEVHAEALAAEQVDPGALLLVQVRLDA